MTSTEIIIPSSPRVLPCRFVVVNGLFWAALVTTIAFEISALRYMGLHIRFQHIASLIWLEAVAIFAMIYGYFYRKNTLAMYGNVFSQLACAIIIIDIGQYISPYFHFPLYDRIFITLDGYLGFSWLDDIKWVNARPLLIECMNFAYNTPIQSVYLLLCLLFFYEASAHAQRFIIGIYIASICTLILAAIFPAIGGYAYYSDIHDFIYDDIATVHLKEATIQMGLRKHEMTSVNFIGEGIINLPSFHAIMAILIVYASQPLRYVRVFMLYLNAFMLFALPYIGGHYLCDIISGIVIAFIAIYCAEELLPRNSQL